MDRREILALYEWAIGDCFRCAQTGALTARFCELDTPIGDCYELRACEQCILQLEEEGRRDADKHGREYQPGRLGSGEA